MPFLRQALAMMALLADQLNPIYWFPWYNNTGLDTQLRFGVPWNRNQFNTLRETVPMSDWGSLMLQENMAICHPPGVTIVLTLSKQGLKR